MKTDKGCKDNNNVDITPKWKDIRTSSDMNELSETVALKILK